MLRDILGQGGVLDRLGRGARPDFCRHAGAIRSVGVGGAQQRFIAGAIARIAATVVRVSLGEAEKYPSDQEQSFRQTSHSRSLRRGFMSSV